MGLKERLGWEPDTVLKNADFKIKLTWVRLLSSAISGDMVSGIRESPLWVSVSSSKIE